MKYCLGRDMYYVHLFYYNLVDKSKSQNIFRNNSVILRIYRYQNLSDIHYLPNNVNFVKYIIVIAGW